MRTVYHDILGEEWRRLGSDVQAFLKSSATFRGNFTVVEGGLLARALRVLLRMPRRGHSVPVSLRMIATNAGERWERTFGDRSFASVLMRRGDLLVERFDLTEFVFRLHVESRSIRFDHVSTNAAIGLVYGAMLGQLAPILVHWASSSTELSRARTEVPNIRECFAIMAVGVLASGARDLLAVIAYPRCTWPWSRPAGGEQFFLMTKSSEIMRVP